MINPTKISLSKAAKIAKPLGFGKLLTSPKANPKLAKSSGYYNCGISLSPASTSGVNVCVGSTPLCRAGCLGDTGHAFVDTHYGNGRVSKSRIARTLAFANHREAFDQILFAECQAAERAAERMNTTVAFRPDILSDLRWDKSHRWLFESFSHWAIYGYTKVMSKARDFINGKMPANYHLTLSWSERLAEQINRGKYSIRGLLESGINIAVPFYDSDSLKGAIPTEWEGETVINGDESDLRFNDPVGVIVGLKVKVPNDRKIAVQRIQENDGFFVGVDASNDWLVTS